MPPPEKLHRVNGYDSSIALLGAFFDTREGLWFTGAPTHLVTEVLGHLAERGFFLGVEDRSED